MRPPGPRGTRISLRVLTCHRSRATNPTVPFGESLCVVSAAPLPLPSSLRPLSSTVTPRGPREGHVTPSSCRCPNVASDGPRPSPHPYTGTLASCLDEPPGPACSCGNPIVVILTASVRGDALSALCALPGGGRIRPFPPFRHLVPPLTLMPHVLSDPCPPRGTLRLALLSEDKPRRSPGELFFCLRCIYLLPDISLSSLPRVCHRCRQPHAPNVCPLRDPWVRLQPSMRHAHAPTPSRHLVHAIGSGVRITCEVWAGV
jgi:hypothetical protein